MRKKSKDEVASVAVRAYPSTRAKLKKRSVKEKRPIPAILKELVEAKGSSSWLSG